MWSYNYKLVILTDQYKIILYHDHLAPIMLKDVVDTSVYRLQFISYKLGNVK